MTDMTERVQAVLNSLHESKAGRKVRDETRDLVNELAARLAELEAERDAKDRVISDLTMLVVNLSKYAPDKKVSQAFDYLNRKNLSSPLRGAALSEQSPVVESAMVRFWKRLAAEERARAEAAEAEVARLRTATGAARGLLKRSYDALGEDLPPREFNKLMADLERALAAGEPK